MTQVQDNPANGESKAALLEVALQYSRRGWSIIPIPFREKAPRLKGWQAAQLTEADLPSHFGPTPTNVGVLLGEPSGWLIDIDLDSKEAVRAAKLILPATCTFGRASRPCSHYLYRASEAETRTFKDPKTKARILELRSTGQQTVVPGSVHPSGEEVRWDRDGEPMQVASNDLNRLAARTAAAALLGAHWPGVGSRNDAAMALGGALLRIGWSVPEVELFVRAVAESAGDGEASARVATVAPTKAKLDAGVKVTGAPRVRQIIDAEVATKALEWLGAEGNPGDAPTGKPTPAGDPIEAVLATGKFYRAQEVAFFVPTDGGDAIDVRSRRFEAYVARVCKLRRGKALKETVAALTDQAMTSTTVVQTQHLAAIGTGGEVFLHLGEGVVLRFRDGKYERVPNGTAGLLFDSERGLAPLTPEKLKQAYRPNDRLFATFRRVVLDRLPPPGGHLSAVEQEALVLATWVGIFIRPWATGRPILLLLGPPGSGKSVQQRLLAKLFFGPEGDTAGGTMLDRVMKDISAAAVHRAFVARDDVNDLPLGAIDVLCRLATGTVFEVANFNETLSLGSYKGRAQLVLSAFSPSWLQRADLMSRFHVVEFDKGLPTDLTERQRVTDVLEARDAVWAETLRALTVIAGDLPSRAAIGRFDDWERALAPIMAAAGCGDAFDSALRKMPVATALLAARSDPLLGLLLRLAQEPDFGGRWFTAAEIVDQIAVAMGIQSREREPHRASGLTRNPAQMAKFLAKLEREGGAVVNVEKRDAHSHVKVWRITPRFTGMPYADRAATGGDGGDLEPPLLEFKEENESVPVPADAEDTEDVSGTPPTPPELE